ncbi:hypothetical protein [Methylopila turkensis]|uniref:DUF3617 family protein n=1 Tax=Methylopila turkensis TaxID=1437816 RepID=A0A9W6N6V5_9HYPH|nr:hypothetical protein [Methylopila turkensis]GLK79706.1 hypothetical protein GCM10008174_14470 [Methylopila turkensis]
MAKFTLCALGAVALALVAGQARAEDPVQGTWSPTCAPSPAQEIDNKLATIVFFQGAVKFRDQECTINGWGKKRKQVRSEITCFARKGGKPATYTIAVQPDGEKLRVIVSDRMYKHVVERCDR